MLNYCSHAFCSLLLGIVAQILATCMQSYCPYLHGWISHNSEEHGWISSLEVKILFLFQKVKHSFDS